MTDPSTPTEVEYPPDPPPVGAPKAVDVIEEVLQDAFKGTTDVDLQDLAAQCVDALQGDELRVELRWYDGTDPIIGWDAGCYVLTDDHRASLAMAMKRLIAHVADLGAAALRLPPTPSHSGESEAR